MRIHRIALTNFRGVTDTTVTFADEGVTIVEGDNEAGKSTLLEALDLLLTTKSSSRSNRVSAAKPIGRDVSPEAEAELTIGDQRVTIRKRWLSGQETVLTLHGAPDVVVTGGDGHDRLDALIDDHVDRQLLDTLQVLQGTKLDQASLVSRALSTALDVAAGVDTSGQLEDGLWDRILAERSQYWTETGQKRIERRHLDEAITANEQRRDEVVAALRTLESDVTRVARLRHEAADRAARIEEHTPEFERLAEQMTTIDNLSTAQRTAQGQRQQAQHEVTLAETQMDNRRKLIDDVTSREADLLRLSSENPLGPDLDSLDAEVKRATQDRDAAATELQRLKDSRATAEEDERLLRDLFDLELLDERLTKYTEAQAALNAAEATLRSLTITPELLAEIEALHEKQIRSSGAADDQAVSVEIEAMTTVEVTDDDSTSSIEAETTAHLDVASRTEITVPGAVRLTITPGRSVEELHTRHRELTADLERLLAQASVADVAAARLAERSREEAANNARARTEEIEGLLRDLTPESMKNRVEHLRASTNQRLDSRPGDPPLPPDLDSAMALRSDAVEAVETAERGLATLDDALREATTRLDDARTEAGKHGVRIEQAEAELKRAREQLDVARHGSPDDVIDEQLRQARTILGEADAEIGKLLEQLRQLDAESTQVQYENARDTIQRAEQERDKYANEAKELEISLEARGEQGLASQVEEIERVLEESLAERKRIDARAEAALLLAATFEKHRAAAQERYLAPLKREIERLGRLVFGEDLGVTLSDDLLITERTLNGQTVPFDQLSVGAQEQLGVLARLACAALVGDEGGAPVILDDALGWSDPHRLSRMGAALNLAGRASQIIVLTCFPDRYAAIGGAQVTRLDS